MQETTQEQTKRPKVRAVFDTTNSMHIGRRRFGRGKPRKDLALRAHDAAVARFPMEQYDWEYVVFDTIAHPVDNFDAVREAYARPPQRKGKNSSIFSVWHNEGLRLSKMKEDESVRIVIFFTDGKDNRSPELYRSLYSGFFPRNAFPIFVSFGRQTAMTDAYRHSFHFDGSDPDDDGDDPEKFYRRFADFCNSSIDFNSRLNIQHAAAETGHAQAESPPTSAKTVVNNTNRPPTENRIVTIADFKNYSDDEDDDEKAETIKLRRRHVYVRQ